MPISTTILVKSLAAVLATTLGAFGGFNYVTGGPGNDIAPSPAQTSISSVSAAYASPADLIPESTNPIASCLDEQSECQIDNAQCPVHQTEKTSAYELDPSANEG